MKITYRHLIKIFSCSVVICTVILCSIFVPANAATVVLLPLDYANGMSQTSDGTTLYNFRFKLPPYFECFNGSTLAHTATGTLDWQCEPNYDFYRISISPLGNTVYNGTVIDVSDFKTGAVLDVTFNALLQVDIRSEGSSSLTYIARSQMLLYWFDKDMNLIKTENTGAVEKSFTHGDVDAWLLQNSYDMSILDEAAYVSPRFVTQIYRPDSGDIITVKSTDTLWLSVVVEKDDVNAESMLLENIEKQLDDLNDKADTIISGSDSMQEDVDNFSSDTQITEEAMDELMDELVDLPQVDMNDIDLSLDGLLEEKGFKNYSHFFLTLSKNEVWVSMMIIVCTFIWVSTLLYGRRG